MAIPGQFWETPTLDAYIEASNLMYKEALEYDNKLKEEYLKKYPWAINWTTKLFKNFENTGQPVSINGVVRTPITYNNPIAISKDTKTEELHKQSLSNAKELRDIKEASEKLDLNLLLSSVPGLYPMFLLGVDKRYGNITGENFTPYTLPAGLSVAIEAVTPFIPEAANYASQWMKRSFGSRASRIAAIMDQNMLHPVETEFLPYNVGWGPRLILPVRHASNSSGSLLGYYDKRWDVINEGANPNGAWFLGLYGTPRETVRLYRANPQNAKFRVQDAENGAALELYAGMWFTDDPEKTSWYASNYLRGKNPYKAVDLLYIDIPKSLLEQYRASKILPQSFEYEPEDFIIPFSFDRNTVSFNPTSKPGQFDFFREWNAFAKSLPMSKGDKAQKVRNLFANRPVLLEGDLTMEKPLITVGDVPSRSKSSYQAEQVGSDGIIYNGVYDNGYDNNQVILAFNPDNFIRTLQNLPSETIGKSRSPYYFLNGLWNTSAMGFDIKAGKLDFIDEILSPEYAEAAINNMEEAERIGLHYTPTFNKSAFRSLIEDGINPKLDWNLQKTFGNASTSMFGATPGYKTDIDFWGYSPVSYRQTAAHEGAHAALHGMPSKDISPEIAKKEYEYLKYKTSEVFTDDFSAGPYLLTGKGALTGEAYTNCRDLGKELGVSFAQPYPGDKKVLEILNSEAAKNSTKAGLIPGFRKDNLLAVWKALNGTLFLLIPGLVGASVISNKQGGRLVSKAKSGIHIKEENKGKFTKSAKQAGLSVLEHAKSVLNNPNATPLQKKRANFARNSDKWHKK